MQTDPIGEGLDCRIRRAKWGPDGKKVLDEHGKVVYYDTTVKEDIKRYGCLITCYTMLLRDRGKNVSVTDLYKANYRLKTGKDFDSDCKEGRLQMDDMYAEAKLVQSLFEKGEVLEGDVKQEVKSVKFPSSENPSQSVRDAIQASQLPIILHVSTTTRDGHYIVVDGINDDGSFRVRDPLKGIVENATIGTKGASYSIVPGDHSIRFIGNA